MNTLTDSLKIVNREEGRDTFHLFRRKRTEQYGFALAVFRKQGLLGLILSSDISVESDIQRRYDRLRIKNGDVILSINLGPQPLKISETLPTQDNWPRSYQLELELAVNAPIQFAQSYIQETDPVTSAKTAIEGYIQHSARFWDHDEITDTMLREWALQSLTVPQNTTSGMIVKAVHKAFPDMNPDRAKEIELDRRRQFQEKQIQTEGYLKRSQKKQDIYSQQQSVEAELEIERIRAEEERKAQEVLTEFQRKEAIKQKEHDDAQKLIELDEQRKRLEKTFGLQSADVEQQLSIDARHKKHEQDMILFTLIEELKQITHQQQLEMEKAKQQQLLATRLFEDQTRQQWIAKIGEGAIPGLIERIREQLSDEKSSLGSAVSDPELQYFLDIISGGNATPKLLNGPQAFSQAQNVHHVSPVPESRSSSQQPITAQFRALKALPGVVQQSEDTIEIPDLGLRLIQATLSDNQLDLTGSHIGHLIYFMNTQGPFKPEQLQIGDIIVSINNQELNSVYDVSQAMSKLENGTEVILHYLRGYAFDELKVSLPRL